MEAAMPPPAIRLFGTFRLECGSGALVVPPNGQRLLANLGLQKSTTRTVVAGTLWPDVADEYAQGSLRTTLWRLHRVRAGVVQACGDALSLCSEVSVDVQVFIHTALRLVSTPEEFGDELPLELLNGADLLPGWGEEWVVVERERLRQLRIHAIETLSALLMDRGRHALALEAALTCVRMEPLRESAHRAVVAVHLAEGNAVEAYRHYEQFRALIRRELEAEPSDGFAAMLRPRGRNTAPAQVCLPQTQGLL